ncbi:hypothetical protein CERSUDRAFT_72759 [Gelatoporia subvermispora B]|uniref:Uncharacterized protein n=1 Tax=Ceriporiopsis subvermispora (strain B) TaxID=914234 RepID=M2QMA8_CERS8|nr:hypothetical protein CERSUDRAFT_72759 [Gelatoporia subvermispora B]
MLSLIQRGHQPYLNQHRASWYPVHWRRIPLSECLSGQRTGLATFVSVLANYWLVSALLVPVTKPLNIEYGQASMAHINKGPVQVGIIATSLMSGTRHTLQHVGQSLRSLLREIRATWLSRLCEVASVLKLVLVLPRSLQDSKPTPVHRTCISVHPDFPDELVHELRPGSVVAILSRLWRTLAQALCKPGQSSPVLKGLERTDLWPRVATSKLGRTTRSERASRDTRRARLRIGPSGASSRPAGRTTVKFRNTEDNDDPIRDFEDPDIAEEHAEDDDNGVMEMLTMLEEIQKRKAKSGSRSAEFQRKKTAIYDEARKNAGDIVREGVLCIMIVTNSRRDQVKAKIAELKSQEASLDRRLEDLSPSMQRQDPASQDAVRTVFDTYAFLLEELSQRRADHTNEVSAALTPRAIPVDRLVTVNAPVEIHASERHILRRSLLKSAKILMDEALEKQNLAADATALIKHYKALLIA